MNPAGDLAKMLPGMEFLQGLMRNAGAAIPGMNNWVTPTLDPEELDKRIQDLRTVQFWLEQNARLLATTIQALEVQRMTLTTLQTMNLPLADLAQALQARVPTARTPVPGPFAAPAPTPAPAPAPVEAAEAPALPAEPAGEAATSALVDPMQWWGALTQQFGEIAAKAMKDGAVMSKSAAEAPSAPAGSRAGAGGKAGSKAGTTAATGTAARAKPRPVAKKAAAKRARPGGRA